MVINNKLETKTHFKKVDCTNFIHANSCHLKAWKDNIPIDQSLHIRKNCSRIEDFEGQITLLAEEFNVRGYDEGNIDKAIKKAKTAERELSQQMYPHVAKQEKRGKKNAIEEALIDRITVKNKHEPISSEHYLNMTLDCKKYKKNQKFVTFALSKEEEAFPIAYSMVIHDDIEMFERLLRAIYMPQNVYCVHVDEKATDIFKKAVRAITSCFDNVFVASKLEKVVYASWSRVQADLNCMQDLLKSEVQWKYLINTCGTDFPLKTNKEIVTALKMLKGKNNLESEEMPVSKKKRWQFHYEVNKVIYKTSTQKSDPPGNIKMFTGSAYFVINRDFVITLFENSKVKQLIEWVKDTYSPDEHLWATLNRMPGVPGSVPAHKKYDMSDLNAIPRLVKWYQHAGDMDHGSIYAHCSGVYRRSVCVYGIADLPWLLQHHHLFANKFGLQVDNNVIQCLEQYLRYKSLYDKEL
ncbi:beta-1,3-galactosyl-O-glycosyl-glycoprotein beta-1,6-N-acetylglucosaminyltransferase 3-like [Bombina bombina]|uniref:beta-1,3-galactosyl-O-glycosyl-glycoprotein beta-1,6-N-acetylglucosaminyltransferase 3-like n=1 Tax=Bombina bombina TaxID=8345 RepID=UPI00235AD707|nr:beta-1,3-galactosyl-O-glycosyl-glycoprotein beta-1,6-N-acetylglucosaminyltransferase 3-like [Bombina bombina]